MKESSLYFSSNWEANLYQELLQKKRNQNIRPLSKSVKCLCLKDGVLSWSRHLRTSGVEQEKFQRRATKMKSSRMHKTPMEQHPYKNN